MCSSLSFRIVAMEPIRSRRDGPVATQQKETVVMEAMMDLRMYIRDIPDFPSAGILFKDITPLLEAPEAFHAVIEKLTQNYADSSVEAVVAIEARGFLFGAALAYRLKVPLVLIRKEGKLPAETTSVTYSLEYGSDTLEMHKDSITRGQRVVIIDDVLATGGTLKAAVELLEDAGAIVQSVAVLIELAELGGRWRLQPRDIFALVQY